MRISPVSGNKLIERIFEDLFTAVVWKIVPFLVMEEDVVFDVVYACNLPTFIHTLSQIKGLCGSMSYNLSSACSTSIVSGDIVVTLNPEFKGAPSIDHFIIGGLVASHYTQV